MSCVIYRLGLIGYDKAWRMQSALLERRANNELNDTILLLEHPPTITLGRSGKAESVLVPLQKLEERGISFFKSDRGGDATFHGPGQLVCYPIINLRESKKTVNQFIYELEEIVISTLHSFEITGSREESHAGVWSENREIAALGLAVKKGVSMHGFALNVSTDLSCFAYIRPCGLQDGTMTSINELTSQNIKVDEVVEKIVPNIARVFNVHLEWGLVESLKSYL
jgi:lipoyl(octanoyl) transferase